MNNTIYVFPTDEQLIVATLDTVLNEPWARNNILPTIAKKFAGRELVERGIDLTWELACYEAWKEQADVPAVARTAFDMSKPDFIETLKLIADRRSAT